MGPSKKLIQAIAVTAELTGTEMSEAAATVFAKKLAVYPEQMAMAALDKCVDECRHRLTLADVISRIDDGRPGPEEAWAMVPKDEGTSVVWSDEMCGAYGMAASLIANGDMIAARMAFLESYRKLVSAARARKYQVNWEPSLGHDPLGREDAIRQAVDVGRLTTQQAKYYLPNFGKPKLISPEKVDAVTKAIVEMRKMRNEQTK